MISSDVLVIGGGFAGLAAAAALSKAGATVTILEALEGTMPTFRGELLHSPGVRALHEIGLGDVVSPDFGVDVHGFAAFDGADRDPVVLPYASRSEPGFGFDHVTLVKHLRTAIATSARTKLVTRARVEDLVYERGRAVGVRCTNGLDFRASLLVAADGRHSKVRRLLRIPTTTTLLSHMVIVSLERDLLPRPGFGHVFVGPPGPALAYPYAQGKVRMCIDVPLAMATGRERIASYVREHYARFIPAPLRDALVATLERGELSGCANHAIYTSACVAPGVALIGDAGGCSHPLTATGMTAALHDVSTLTACLSRAGGSDAGRARALDEYQRRRYRFVRAREVFAHAMYEVFREAGPGALSLRAGMFRYWQANERARRASMRILAGDDSRVTSFLAEYARVMADSGRLAWGGAQGGSGLWQVGRMLAASMEGLRPLLDVARLNPQGPRSNAD
ncbi:MAG TPA: NAD(P)/FAD-dependent oxidoreductase [Polyangiaceae bacterium]|nr:NAD(P)/FAD-dependent oxidoreductase [Polyangiaceae bacterium]